MCIYSYYTYYQLLNIELKNVQQSFERFTLVEGADCRAKDSLIQSVSVPRLDSRNVVEINVILMSQVADRVHTELIIIWLLIKRAKLLKHFFQCCGSLWLSTTKYFLATFMSLHTRSTGHLINAEHTKLWTNHTHI